MDKLASGRIKRKLREKLSLKQEDIGEMTGITSKTIYLIETLKGNLSTDTLTKLMEVLGLEALLTSKRLNNEGRSLEQ